MFLHSFGELAPWANIWLSCRWWIIVCLVDLCCYIGISLICSPQDEWQFLLFGWIIPLTHCSALLCFTQLFFHHTWDLQKRACLSLPPLPMTSLKVSRIQTSNPGTQTTHTICQKAQGSRWSCQLIRAVCRPRHQVNGFSAFSGIWHNTLCLPECYTLVQIVYK